MTSPDSSTLKTQLTKLGLHSMASLFESEADRAAKSESSYTSYLAGWSKPNWPTRPTARSTRG